ncbi:MAG: sigma-70 family RNA polymerase sigma factor [Lachnospiraceae bacterium]|nr:sigma-70 family RNA polymerase sigma factor [Lachnospiraceae bacterium]
MDKQRLMEYQKLKREQELLARRLDALRARELPVVAGKVKASSREFPYTEHRVSVQMDEPAAADRVRRMQKIYQERQERIERQMLEIEEFIDRIGDAETRQIFEMRFIEGLKLREIANMANRDLSGIGKKINSFLKVSKNSKKSVL